VSTPSTWGWKRRAATALDRAHLLGPAISLYETLLGMRGALRTGRHAEAGTPPVPPAHFRVKIGPPHADLDVFLRSGGRHADLIREVLKECGSDPSAAAPILDFGCGCGRVARHWYGANVELCGCDLNRRLVEWCRQNLPFGQFDLNKLEPPLPYDDGSFGLAYAFSVFTHLPEHLQREWLREFERVLRPDGYLLVSTQGEYYVGLDRLDEHERRRFDKGELVVLFDDHAGENVCSAYHPQTYVAGTLAEGFDYVVYRKGNEQEHQDMHLLRKRPSVEQRALG
jgi:SAM-dependent methyltransferase